MSKLRHNQPALPLDAALFAGKPRKPVPHEFVLDAIAPLSPETRPMFGCLAIYVGEKIVLILRDKPTYTADNGVWLATTEEHHLSLLPEFPNMRSIGLLGKKVTGWQVLPVDAPDFEEAALHACDLVLAGDPRIGKVPASRRASKAMSRKAVSRKAVSRKAVSRKAVSRKAVSRKGTNSSKPASALGSSKSRKKKSSRSSKS